MNTSSTEIGLRIKKARKAAKMSQTVLGTYLNKTLRTIQKYESGIITNIPSDKIMLLAEILETTPAFIMGWESNPERYAHDSNTMQKKICNGIDSEDDKLNEEIIRLFSQLSAESKKKAVEYIEFLLSREDKQ